MYDFENVCIPILGCMFTYYWMTLCQKSNRLDFFIKNVSLLNMLIPFYDSLCQREAAEDLMMARSLK